ncbi:hypothetical protein GOV05_03580 [Candidatus Woesearchaeota archaeon]|nr:hypothetical protein [Candidatus Woesearchaeota archaeon]
MKYKTILITTLMLLISLFAVSANPIAEEVYVDNVPMLSKTGSTTVERGEEFDVKVEVFSDTPLKNIVVSAEILGYEYSRYDDSLQDESDTFDLDADDRKFVKLYLNIPDNAERDYYDLRVRVASRTNPSEEYLIRLNLKGKRHNVIIRDIEIPNTVVAGRAILGNVRVKNIGDRDEDGIKVTLSIPDLGVEDSEFIDDLESDDSTTSEDLLLRIPACTKEGFYDVVAEVKYNDYYDETTKLTDIKVLESDLCEAQITGGAPSSEKTLVTVPSSQEVKAGQSAVYPIMISNLGKTSKTYVVSVSPAVDSFATYRLDPSNVMIVNAKDTNTAYLYVTVDEDAQSGLKDFRVTVQADGESKDITLTASVVSEAGSDGSSLDLSSGGVKTGLQISLLVLVVLLLILLIIFGFNKLKEEPRSDEDEDEPGQTYY